MEDFDTNIDYDGNIPEGFRAVQKALNQFVTINYDVLETMIISTKTDSIDLSHYKSKIQDIIRNNPPLISVSRYYQDGREDYLWYSDFYDDISKVVYHQYRMFTPLAAQITSANYTEELAKIDLPYFGALVDLISLEHLCLKYQKHFPASKEETTQKQLQTKVDLPTKENKTKTTKRSYEPKLSREQYKLLTTCVEAIRLFRLKVKQLQLKKLLDGKLSEPLQVANQKTLVYLFDQLMEAGYIKDTWIAVADGNADFISFRTEKNKQRYGSKPHPINMQQLINCRNRNKREAITGMDDIDDLIEQMEANPDE